MSPRHDLIVSPEEAGIRIDRYLTSMLAGHSRSQIQRLIKDGKVTVAGLAVPANRVHVIANVLLVKRGLRASWFIGVARPKT